ncbi:type I-B CRISPR-associated protein Cas5b [Anaerovorax odorimutans]|uniref:Type I-B CRISPR-associated protein Cas5b n=1 Tax=Anaerovorax odorimutans TaxID=109327 RepID=A0ABT1RLD2_9FIRM|nr:type I-B CRISPR-associated protein Cas5b [Anaerovorax odorimutans]MCQ4635972.1 type I-B CRISPR-associated protein Cas5b [Anaerovorax odorimutans]
MDILKFTLSGKDAFFKKPEVNSYYYFTYGNIHKVALLGIFGAVLGYGGYRQMEESDINPEFYRKLKRLRISIAPDEKGRGSFSRKIQSFNNSVGYASNEKGGNLIVKQQWLENPCWDIYVKLDTEESLKLKESLLNRKSIYLPYLGSNDHPADIRCVEVCRAEPVKDMEEERIDSLFPNGTVVLDFDGDSEYPYLYQEFLPLTLDETSNQYQLERFFFSNFPVEEYSCEIYDVKGKHIVFF